MIIVLVVGVILLVKRRNKTNKQLQQNLPDIQIKQTQQKRMAKSPQEQSLCDTTMAQDLAYTAHIFRFDDHPADTVCEYEVPLSDTVCEYEVPLSDTVCEYEVPLPTSNVSWFCSNTQPSSHQDGVRDAAITSNPAYGVVYQQKRTPAYADKEDATLN